MKKYTSEQIALEIMIETNERIAKNFKDAGIQFSKLASVFEEFSKATNKPLSPPTRNKSRAGS